MSDQSSNLQPPSSREAPNIKHQSPRRSSDGPWDLGFGVSLELGRWRLELRRRVRLTSFAILMLSALPVARAEPTPSQIQFFENKIRPVLANNCYKCHSQQAEKVKGGLLLDTKEGLLKGGENGPVIIPGDPEKSLLIKAIRHTDKDLQMPRNDKKLTDSQITNLVAWVKMGAPDPRLIEPQVTGIRAKAKEWWAFRALQKPKA